MTKHILYTVLLLMLAAPAVPSQAQSSTARQETRKGNREYKAKRYDQAEVNYRRAIHHDSTSYRAHYNLGNSLYRQKKYDEAATHYGQALEQPGLADKTRSRILHNRGNSYLRAGLDKENRADGMEQFQHAVTDYQEALKLNPKNDDTRYNLSYAKKLLQQAQQQQQQGGGQDQKNDKNKDGNNGQDQQQQQDQNKDGQQNNQQQQQKEQQDKQQNKQQQQQQQQKKQDAERLLEAVKNNEKNTMKDNAKKVEVASPGRIEKDW